jgi:signal transduction histidine kinase
MNDNIAHDLKSPVARIRGLAEISLSGQNQKDEELTLAGSTIEECDRLLDMINTMLVISQTEAGAGEMNPEPVNLAEVVRGAVELFTPLAEDKGLVLCCDVPEALPVNGDLKMLQRALANLVDNAIKYTPAPGQIDIQGLIEKKSGEICIRVRDSGVGIESRDLPKIFNRFFRCDQSRTTGGSGLGLSLVRAVARAHGGEVTVESLLGMGSLFSFSIPSGRAI